MEQFVLQYNGTGSEGDQIVHEYVDDKETPTITLQMMEFLSLPPPETVTVSWE